MALGIINKSIMRKEFMMQQKVWRARIFFCISFILFLSEIAVAGAPVPWGAKLIRMEDFSGSEKGGRMAIYETGASKQELINYYLKEMPNKGYTLYMNGEQNIVFKKGEEMVVVMLPPPAEGKVRFIVTTVSMEKMVRDGKPSCENIPSVPVYPGARCNRSIRLGSGKGQVVTYSSTDNPDVVLNYYRSSMMRFQWRLIDEINIADNIQSEQGGVAPENAEITGQLFKGARLMKFINNQDSSCAITVMNNFLAGGALISVNYEEKKSK